MDCILDFYILIIIIESNLVAMLENNSFLNVENTSHLKKKVCFLLNYIIIALLRLQF